MMLTWKQANKLRKTNKLEKIGRKKNKQKRHTKVKYKRIDMKNLKIGDHFFFN